MSSEDDFLAYIAKHHLDNPNWFAEQQKEPWDGTWENNPYRTLVQSGEWQRNSDPPGITVPSSSIPALKSPPAPLALLPSASPSASPSEALSRLLTGRPMAPLASENPFSFLNFLRLMPGSPVLTNNLGLGTITPTPRSPRSPYLFAPYEKRKPVSAGPKSPLSIGSSKALFDDMPTLFGPFPKYGETVVQEEETSRKRKGSMESNPTPPKQHKSSEETEDGCSDEYAKYLQNMMMVPTAATNIPMTRDRVRRLLNSPIIGALKPDTVKLALDVKIWLLSRKVKKDEFSRFILKQPVENLNLCLDNPKSWESLKPNDTIYLHLYNWNNLPESTKHQMLELLDKERVIEKNYVMKQWTTFCEKHRNLPEWQMISISFGMKIPEEYVRCYLENRRLRNLVDNQAKTTGPAPRNRDVETMEDDVFVEESPIKKPPPDAQAMALKKKKLEQRARLTELSKMYEENGETNFQNPNSTLKYRRKSSAVVRYESDNRKNRKGSASQFIR